MVGPLGDLGRLVIADMGIEGGHQHQGAAHQLVDTGAVGLDADRTVAVEAGHAVGQQAHALQEVVGH